MNCSHTNNESVSGRSIQQQNNGTPYNFVMAILVQHQAMFIHLSENVNGVSLVLDQSWNNL